MHATVTKAAFLRKPECSDGLLQGYIQSVKMQHDLSLPKPKNKEMLYLLVVYIK